MNHTNVRNLSGLYNGSFDSIDVAGNIMQQDGTYVTNLDISGSSLVGVPLNYYTGLTDNIQLQMDNTKTFIYTTISHLLYFNDTSNSDLSNNDMSNNPISLYNNWRGINIYDSYLPLSKLVPTNDNNLVNKRFVNYTISHLLYFNDTSNSDMSNNDMSNNPISLYNNWRGINIYDSYLPLSKLAPTTTNHLVNKRFVDLTISHLLYFNDTSNSDLSNNDMSNNPISLYNNWRGINIYDSYLPLSKLAPTTTNHLVNKRFVDLTISHLLYFNDTSNSDLSNNDMSNNPISLYNNWRGINIYDSYLPLSKLLPTISGHLVNKCFVDLTISHLLYYSDNSNNDISNVNVWGGYNVYNSYLPSSTLLPTISGHLVNKRFVDLTISHLLYYSDNINNDISNVNVWGGYNVYNSYLPSSTLLPTISGHLVNKRFVDLTISHLLSYDTSNNINVWSGSNIYNTNLPSSTLLPTSNDDLTNKRYIINTISGLLSNDFSNNWLGVNTFNKFLPTSTITPTTLYQFTNKYYVDDTVSGMITISALLNRDNVWLQDNTFNAFLPTSTIKATTNYQFVNKLTVAYSISGLLSADYSNAWTGINTYDKVLPTSTKKATTQYELVNKSFVDFTISGLLSADTSNNWLGINTYNSVLPTSTKKATDQYEFATKSVVDFSISGLLFPAVVNNWYGNNSYKQLPTSRVVPTNDIELVTKFYTDQTISGLLASNNAIDTLDTKINKWVGINTYTVLPTSTVAPTTDYQFANKYYVDSSISGLLGAGTSNTYLGNNTYNVLPTCTVKPTTDYQFVNKYYVDLCISGLNTTISSNVLITNNTWTGTNTYNILPKCTVYATDQHQFVNKSFVDYTISGLLGAGTSNTWLGANIYNQTLPTSTKVPTTDYQLVNKLYTDTNLEKTRSYMMDASGSAHECSNYQENTRSYAYDASGSAHNANISKQSATSSSDNATTKASQASSAATEATGAAATATAAAGQAGFSATAAAGSVVACGVILIGCITAAAIANGKHGTNITNYYYYDSSGNIIFDWATLSGFLNSPLDISSYAILSSNNTWTGSNTFTTFPTLPVLGTPYYLPPQSVASAEYVNYWNTRAENYAEDYTTNAINNNILTTSAYISSQIINVKQQCIYSFGEGFNTLINGNNSWTGTNAFLNPLCITIYQQ